MAERILRNAVATEISRSDSVVYFVVPYSKNVWDMPVACWDGLASPLRGRLWNSG